MSSPATARTSQESSRPIEIPPLLEAMLDAIPALALLTRGDGTVVYCNDPLVRASGWNQDTSRARRLDELLPAEAAAHLLASTGPALTRAALTTAAGRSLTIEWTARTISSEGGDRFLCISGRDITREAALESHLVQNQWFETAAALSGGLAHDFNNVLAAILGLSEIISLRLPPDHALQEFSGKIGLSVDRAKHLVRRFSQFSRKNAGGAEAQPTAMILEELAKLLRGFMPGSVTFALELSPETPWCDADRGIVEQIILNCANFLRAKLRTDNGAVKLTCQSSDDGKIVIIDLSGSGQGLLGLDHDACFGLDLRATATAYESGTGLYVARILATGQNGRLRLVRRDPRTVSFVLELPVAK